MEINRHMAHMSLIHAKLLIPGRWKWMFEYLGQKAAFKTYLLFIFALSSAWLMSSSKATVLAAQTLLRINFPAVCPPRPSSLDPFASLDDRTIILMAANVKYAQAVLSVNAEDVGLIQERKGKEG